MINRIKIVMVGYVMPFFMVLLPMKLYALDELTCGAIDNHFGPFDYRYRAQRPEDLHIVEIRHFTLGVQTLTRQSTGAFEEDLHYTLRVWPNHYKALYVMMKRMLSKPWNGSDKYVPLHCYFERAEAFAETDGQIYHLFGLYLHKIKKYKLSLEKYKKAVIYAPESAELHYNYGLLLYDIKDYKESKKNALLAKKLGYPFDGLLKKLRGKE